MKRTQLIEWGIITVGLIFGYKFLEGTISFMIQVLYALGDVDLGKLLLRFVLICGSYVIGFILLIRNSQKIAFWINGSSLNDSVNIKIGKRSLQQVILIGVCVATMLANAAEIITYLVEAFKNQAGRIHEPTNSDYNKHLFKLAAIKVIIAFLILYFSKDISGWFIRKNEADELTFESEAENKD